MGVPNRPKAGVDVQIRRTSEKPARVRHLMRKLRSGRVRCRSQPRVPKGVHGNKKRVA